MINKEILKLIAGFKKFHEKYFSGDVTLYHRLTSAGQTPKTLIIGCSDSRVDPALLSSASPGEIFVVRNVANLVPPYESSNSGFHGVSAAIEFAVVNLKVENIIVLGHRQCGGIRFLMSNHQQLQDSFVGHWMQIADPAKDQVLKKFPDHDFETQCKHCEMVSISISLQNLKSFPFVQRAQQDGSLKIIGIYFDLEQGHLFEYDEPTDSFKFVSMERNSES